MSIQELVDARALEQRQKTARADAEQNVVAALFQWPELQADLFRDLPDPDVFNDEPMGIVWRAALDVFRSGTPVDWQSVKLQIEETEGMVPPWFTLASVRPCEYEDGTGERLYPGRPSVPSWVRTILEDHRFHLFKQAAARARTIADVKAAALAVLEYDRAIDNQDEVPFPDAVSKFMDRQRAITAGEIAAGHSWGIPSLDEQLLLHPGFYCVGALKKAGKSQLLQHTLLWNALHGNPGFLFSLEMATDQVIRRWLSHEMGLNSRHILSRTITGESLAELGIKADALATLPLHINQSPRITTAEIAARARTWKRKHQVPDGMGIVAVDFVQLVPRTANRNQNDAEAIKQIAYDLARIAKELQVAVIAAAQMRNEAEGQRPNIRFLEGSGGIAQAAEAILIMDLKHRTEERAEFKQWKEIDVIVYQRNGESGRVVPLEADLSECRFRGRLS